MSEHATLTCSQSGHLCVWSRVQSITAVRGGGQWAFVTQPFSASVPASARGYVKEVAFLLGCSLFSISCCCVSKRKENESPAPSKQPPSPLLLCLWLRDMQMKYGNNSFGGKTVLVLCLGFRAPDAGGYNSKPCSPASAHAGPRRARTCQRSPRRRCVGVKPAVKRADRSRCWV